MFLLFQSKRMKKTKSNHTGIPRNECAYVWQAALLCRGCTLYINVSRKQSERIINGKQPNRSCLPTHPARLNLPFSLSNPFARHFNCSFARNTIHEENELCMCNQIYIICANKVKILCGVFFFSLLHFYPIHSFISQKSFRCTFLYRFHVIVSRILFNSHAYLILAWIGLLGFSQFLTIHNSVHRSPSNSHVCCTL